MNRPTLARQIYLGLLIGILITPTQLAQAQWAVFDASQYAIQVKKRLEEAERHVKTFDNAVKQLTTLKGVLEKTEDLVAKQRNAITTMSNIGRTVRGVYQLKDQLETIVISRMGALKSINQRLRKGIFDPEADMRDFEEYLRNSIGRSSQDTVANLDEQIANYDLLIAHYNSEIARLECQIEDRKKKYNIQMDERVKFGEQVQSMDKAWSRFNDSLDELQRTLSKY